MPKKKRGSKLHKQLNVRCTEVMYDRVEQLALKMDVDPSDVVRLILNEHLAEHEDRAANAERHNAPKGDNSTSGKA